MRLGKAWRALDKESGGPPPLSVWLWAAAPLPLPSIMYKYKHRIPMGLERRPLSTHALISALQGLLPQECSSP